MKNNKYIITIIAFAILIKFGLFAIGTMRVPDSKFDPDTVDYLNTASTLYSDFSFASKDSNGVLKPHVLRTPGYPIFLAIVHNLMKVPLSGVIFLQVLLTILAAFILYKTTIQIDERLAVLSAIIMLYDLPVSVFSLKLMTEALFLALITLFIYIFIRYLKTGRFKFVLLSSILLVISTYVRPISYYLGIATAVFIVYANIPRNFKIAIKHALIFLIIVYSLLGVWQVRNYRCCKVKSFTSIEGYITKLYGLVREPVEGKNHAGGFITATVKSSFNYLYEFQRAFLSVMTRPGTLKYFHSKPLAAAGKIFGYLLVAFWMIGFLAGIFRIKKNIYFQFLTLLILYFLMVAIVSLGVDAAERFRVPIVPCIAIISSYGWSLLRLI
ncbi:MAG: glycosyltransferase family 39 protein [Candidatus Omnitrophota bacterium]|jgi:hypothetical protein